MFSSCLLASTLCQASDLLLKRLPCSRLALMSFAQTSRRMILPLGRPCANQLSDGSQGHWSPIVGSLQQHWRNMCLYSCNDLQLMIDRCCKKFYWSILEIEPPNTACHRCSSPVSSSTADVIASTLIFELLLAQSFGNLHLFRP